MASKYIHSVYGDDVKNIVVNILLGLIYAIIYLMYRIVLPCMYVYAWVVGDLQSNKGRR
jgi:hypothetical protein